MWCVLPCNRPWFVGEVVLYLVWWLQYVVLDVNILSECEGDGNAVMAHGSGVSVGHYMGGTCGSGSVYSAADVLGMSVVVGDERSWWNV